MRSAGLFDLQVNGFAGVDFNDESIAPDALDHALEAMLSCGVTACLPTLITAPAEVLLARFTALDRAVAASRLGRAMVPGYHLEGPFLNPAEGFAGCHPPEAMTLPDVRLVARLQAGLSRPILLVTLAPERPGGLEAVRALAAQGLLVAIGHSGAGIDTVRAAVEAGARLSTHLGNGLPQLLPKLDNPLFAQLAEDGLAASFIADGIHVLPWALKALLRAKGWERSILVTDAVSAAATSPGLYPFAGMTVEHAPDGSVRLPGSASLAGSALTLDRAVRNLVAWGIATPEVALALASANPRGLLAPTLDAFSVSLPPGAVAWSRDLVPLEVDLPGVGRIHPKPLAARKDMP